jgi:cobalamin biosynthesis protein CbiG
VAGVGLTSRATAADVWAALTAVMTSTGCWPTRLATIEGLRGDHRLLALGLPVVTFSAEELAAVAVPNPSDRVARAIGTPSVAEAAALCAAGPGARLVLAKVVHGPITVAIAEPPGAAFTPAVAPR